MCERARKNTFFEQSCQENVKNAIADRYRAVSFTMFVSPLQVLAPLPGPERPVLQRDGLRRPGAHAQVSEESAESVFSRTENCRFVRFPHRLSHDRARVKWKVKGSKTRISQN